MRPYQFDYTYILAVTPTTNIFTMSRLSVRAFLAAAKRSLHLAIKEKGHASFVIGNESADLDSITCALIYGYIASSKPGVASSGKYVIPITNIPSSDLALRPELTALLKHADIKPSDLITLDDLGKDFLPADKTHWTLVDHNVLQSKLGELYRSRVNGVIDHHDDEKVVPSNVAPRIIQKAGSCSSLVVNYLRDTWQQLSDSASTVGAAHPQDNERLIDDFAYTSTWDAQAAKLALGAVLIDTINMKAEHKVTEHDKKAVRFLEAKINISRKLGKDYDRDTFFNEIDAAKSDIDGLSLEDILRKDYKQWTEGDMTLGISSVVKDIHWLSEREEDFQSTVREYAKGKKLQLFAIMTTYNDDEGFHRELLVIALDNKAKEAAERFIENGKGELQLVDVEKPSVSKDANVTLHHHWNQGNLEASRKQVAPLMREAMGS